MAKIYSLHTKVNFGRYFSGKSAQRPKNRPNGEISPNLVTLAKAMPVRAA
jgi:hypothetical protein